MGLWFWIVLAGVIIFLAYIIIPALYDRGSEPMANSRKNIDDWFREIRPVDDETKQFFDSGLIHTGDNPFGGPLALPLPSHPNLPVRPTLGAMLRARVENPKNRIIEWIWSENTWQPTLVSV